MNLKWKFEGNGKNSGFIFKTNELSNYAQRQRDSRNLNMYYKYNEYI